MYQSQILIIFLFSVFCTSSTKQIVSCYFRYGEPDLQFLDFSLCTHYILIGNCSIDQNYNLVLPQKDYIADLVKNVMESRQKPKLLITLIPDNKRMSKIVQDANLTAKLVDDITQFLVNNAVNGFDIDWEFPVWSSDASSSDKEGLSKLIKALRKGFDSTGRHLLLTAAVSAAYTIVDKAYDVSELNKYLDFVQIMNYDFHIYSKQRPFTGFNAPLFRKFYELFVAGRMNSDYATRYWLKKGLSANKTLFGIPTFGRGYTLLRDSLHTLYAPAVGFSKLGAIYTYPMVCNFTQSQEFKYVFDSVTRSPYLHGGNRQWLGFEDVYSMFSKATYARIHNLAGIMIFNLRSDDYKGICGKGKYPLIKAARSALLNSSWIITNRTPKKEFEKDESLLQ